MIPRYSRPEMTQIWEPANKFRLWFLIEAHACDAQAELGVIPKEAAAAVWAGGDKPYTEDRIARIDEIERETKHDVIAFLTHLAEHVGEESRFVHQGLTSSDVLDTCLAVQMKQSADLLLVGMDRVLAALKKRAFEHKSPDGLALICKAAGIEKALFVTLAVLRSQAADNAFNDAREIGAIYEKLEPDQAERALRFWKLRKQAAAAA